MEPGIKMGSRGYVLIRFCPLIASRQRAIQTTSLKKKKSRVQCPLPGPHPEASLGSELECPNLATWACLCLGPPPAGGGEVVGCNVCQVALKEALAVGRAGMLVSSCCLYVVFFPVDKNVASLYLHIVDWVLMLFTHMCQMTVQGAQPSWSYWVQCCGGTSPQRLLSSQEEQK